MGTILVGIGLFKGPPALTAASEKQNEREVKVAEATRDKAFAEARMPSRSDGTLTGGVPYVGTPTTPFGAPPPGGGGGGIPAPKGVPATPVQLGFPYGVTIKTQMEQLEKQIGELTKQRNEIQLLKEALKKVGEAKTLNQQEQDVFTDWLLYQRLPSGPMNSSANTTFP
jgi:hypothetical protein